MNIENILNKYPSVSMNIQSHIQEVINTELDHDVIIVQTIIGSLKHDIDDIIILMDEILDYRILTNTEKHMVYKLILEYLVMYIDDRNGVDFEAYLDIIYINILEDLREVFKSDILDNELSHKDKTKLLNILKEKLIYLFSYKNTNDFLSKLEYLRDIKTKEEFLDSKKYIMPYLKSSINNNNSVMVSILFIYVI